MKKFAIDLSPLRKYRDLRYLFASGVITRLGSAMTLVSIPFQIKELTNSYLAVGLIGAAEIIPLIIFGLYGGVLADKFDRRKLILNAEIASMVVAALLLINSLLPNPNLIFIYVMAAIFAALDGISSPSMGAIIPRIVKSDDLVGAQAIMTIRWQFGAVVGPSLAGFVVATWSVKAGYAIDVFSYLLSIYLIAQIKPVPANSIGDKPDLHALVEGVKYATSRKDLMGTYLVDLSAMFFAMPNTLFPFWADQLNSRWALGFFYSAGSVGALITVLTGRWMSRYPHHGRAVMLSAFGWGAAITFAGIFHESLVLVLFFLMLAGASDQVSAQMRSLIWNQSIADEYRGRLGGIELLSYMIGPIGGQMRAGTAAAWTNLRTAVISGGLLCIGFIGLFSAALPEFRKYDVRTNKFVIEKREKENFN